MRTCEADTAGTASLEQATWRLDSDRSSVEFHTKNLWGMTTVKGRFTRYEGTLDLSGAPAIELTVDADSLETGNGRRDAHLRSPDFFDAEQHPNVRFVSERAVLEGDRLAARGHLHARGASIPLDIEATLRRCGRELEVEVVTVADHRRLGMTWNLLGMLRAPSTLIVKGRLIRDA
jgi:polyisoprenoid-binding protein YceI